MSVPASSPNKRLRLQTINSEDQILVRCSGRLTSEDSEMLRLEVGKLIPQTSRVVLDLTDLRYMDSSGLGALVRVYVSCKTAGCDLQLINLNQRIKELLGLTNLLSVFSTAGQYYTRFP
ncbi:MAG: STAS domain-containing protein [Terriglobales bacterium]